MKKFAFHFLVAVMALLPAVYAAAYAEDSASGDTAVQSEIFYSQDGTLMAEGFLLRDEDPSEDISCYIAVTNISDAPLCAGGKVQLLDADGQVLDTQEFYGRYRILGPGETAMEEYTFNDQDVGLTKIAGIQVTPERKELNSYKSRKTVLKNIVTSAVEENGVLKVTAENKGHKNAMNVSVYVLFFDGQGRLTGARRASFENGGSKYTSELTRSGGAVTKEFDDLPKHTSIRLFVSAEPSDRAQDTWMVFILLPLALAALMCPPFFLRDLYNRKIAKKTAEMVPVGATVESLDTEETNYRVRGSTYYRVRSILRLKYTMPAGQDGEIYHATFDVITEGEKSPFEQQFEKILVDPGSPGMAAPEKILDRNGVTNKKRNLILLIVHGIASLTAVLIPVIWAEVDENPRMLILYAMLCVLLPLWFVIYRSLTKEVRSLFPDP